MPLAAVGFPAAFIFFEGGGYLFPKGVGLPGGENFPRVRPEEAGRNKRKG